MHNPRPGGGDIVEMSSSATAEGRVIPHSGPLSKKSGARKSARFAESVSAPLSAPPPRASANNNNNDDDDYVEITLDVRDDSVAVHSVKPAHVGGAGAGGDDPDVTLLARTLESRRSSSYGHSVIRNASSRIKQVSQELRRIASINRRGAAGPRIDRSKSAAAHALKGLKFISKAEGAAGWEAVERRFDKLAENGLLHRSKFGQCIGMKEPEFAGELFDALSRRRNISGDSISKAELLEFWDQISDTSFDGRLQTFFDMYD